MSDQFEDEDPFYGDDPAAAEREARRRAREERRRAREEGGGHHSLSERVGEILGGLRPGHHEEEVPEWAAEERYREEEPDEPDAPPEPDYEPEAPEPEPADAGRPHHHLGDDFDTGSFEWSTGGRSSKTDEFDAALQFEPDPSFAEPEPEAEREVSVSAYPGAAEDEDERMPEGLGGGGPTLLSDPVARRRIIAGGGGIALILLLIVLFTSGGDDAEQLAAPAPVETIDVVVPEGLTIDGIHRVAKDARLKGSYRKAVKKAMKSFPLRKYDAQDAPTLEGFLFPATYNLEKRAPAADLVEKQLAAFEENYANVNLKRARQGNLTDYDVIKIASMIEREVSVPRERKLVSSVIYNRLAAGNPLGIDATLRYELDNFDKPLLESELQADTPYNTRTNAGLPPTPIGNPGLAALRAAAKPADNDLFYYVIEPGTCNEHVFTETAAEFEVARAAYQAALEAEGGSPTECP